MIIQVNANGVISFRNPFSNDIVEPFPLLSTSIIIAPFWEDIDINRGGQIYFRSSSDSSILREVGDRAGDGSNFNPSTVFIATWERVAAISSPINPNPIGVYSTSSYLRILQKEEPPST